MLTFRQYLVIEESKKKLQKMISLSVLSFRKDIKTFIKTGIKSPSLVILESAQDVYKLANTDLKQTEKNKRSLTLFLNKFNKLSNDLKYQLVQELSKPTNGKYIENNNEVKLILIYQNDKGSNIGQEAYNAVVMNKEGLFKQVAQEKVIQKKLKADQAADLVQLMFLTLCGGGQYNEKNGGLFSLDAYDPFSGVPFNSFIKSKVIPAAMNKFLAIQNTSVANDYIGYKEGTSVVSTDETINGDDSDDRDLTVGDMIEDKSELGRDAMDLTDLNLKKNLITKALTSTDLPIQFRLTDKEKLFIKLHYFKGLSKKDAARKLGYTEKASAPAARLYLGSEKEEGRDGSAIKKLIQAVKYLQQQLTKKEDI